MGPDRGKERGVFVKRAVLVTMVFFVVILMAIPVFGAGKEDLIDKENLEKSLGRAAADLRKEPFLTKPEIYNRLVRFLTENPEILGSAYATPPFPKGSKRMTYYYVYRRGKDDFGMRENINYNFAESKRAGWYRLPLETLKPRWSEPYSGTDNEGREITMKTYTLPVCDDKDDLLFMVTADIPGGQ